MRNATSSISTSQQLLTSAVDFNRARSSESTENAMGPTSKGGRHHHNHNNHHSSSSMSVASSSGASFASAEGRGVPISPKKMPLTPPRDHGSPYNNNNNNMMSQQQQYHAYAAPAAAAVRQPILSSFRRDSSSSSSSPSPFLRPSNGSSAYNQVSSIFRSAPSSSAAREGMDDAGGFYTIQRCSAFDEDDYSDSDLDDNECYNGMAEF